MACDPSGQTQQGLFDCVRGVRSRTRKGEYTELGGSGRGGEKGKVKFPKREPNTGHGVTVRPHLQAETKIISLTPDSVRYSALCSDIGINI